jgi:hypothetical protein
VECASNEFVSTTDFLHQKRERERWIPWTYFAGGKIMDTFFDPKLMQEI